MPTARLLPVFALLGWVAASGAPIMAQTPGSPSPGAAKAPPVGDIAFYLVHGDHDACGRGCNEWIAAEGRIDAGAAQRLRRLLTKPERRKLTIFFHSPGGLVTGSIELGRLIHDQKLAVGVAHTIPRGCDRDKLREKSCDD